MNQLEQSSQDEKTMAVLAQVLQIVAWWIAPLIIFLMRRNSRFVSFHALQALLLQLLYTLVFGAVMLFFFVSMFAGLAIQEQARNEPPAVLFLAMPVFFVTVFGANVTVWVLAIVYAVKAGRGEWAGYPVLGNLARRILKIGPDGSALTDRN
jgi:uncharacterized membrane protein